MIQILIKKECDLFCFSFQLNKFITDILCLLNYNERLGNVFCCPLTQYKFYYTHAQLKSEDYFSRFVDFALYLLESMYNLLKSLWSPFLEWIDRSCFVDNFDMYKLANQNIFDGAANIKFALTLIYGLISLYNIKSLCLSQKIEK